MACVIAVAAFGWGCSNEPRPAHVPNRAMRSPHRLFEPSGWNYCWVDSAVQLNRCRFWTATGVRVGVVSEEDPDDDVFLPDSGPTPVPESALKYAPAWGPSYVRLTNGVVLIQRANFAHIKRGLDEIKAMPKGPLPGMEVTHPRLEAILDAFGRVLDVVFRIVDP